MDLNLELDSLKKSMHKRLRKEKKSGLKMLSCARNPLVIKSLTIDDVLASFERDFIVLARFSVSFPSLLTEDIEPPKLELALSIVEVIAIF